MLKQLKKAIVDPNTWARTNHHAYMRDELRTYPNKKGLIRFAFSEAPLGEDVYDAQRLTFFQAAYLLPEAALKKMQYVPFLYALNGLESFFYLSPEKCVALAGPAILDQLDAFNQDMGLEVQENRVRLNRAFRDYETTVDTLIQKHGMAAVSYTFDEVQAATTPLSEDYPIFMNDRVWPSLWTYLTGLLGLDLPQPDKHDRYTVLYTELERRLLAADATHALVVRFMKNLRLCDGGWYVGGNETLKAKRQTLQTKSAPLFKTYKR